MNRENGMAPPAAAMALRMSSAARPAATISRPGRR